MPLFAASRRYLLHMAARAWPGAADGSKWLLEPARSRRCLEMVARARPGAANTRKVQLESAPEPQNARRVPLESAPERQNARRVPLEPPRRRKMSTGASRACPGVTACSKSAAQAHSREVRSFLAFEMVARKGLAPVRLLSASAFARLHFASCMLCTGSH